MSPTEGAPIPGFCACATSGHAAAVLPTNAINSRRLMASPAPRTTSGIKRISHFGSRIVPFVPPKRAALRHSTNPRHQMQTLRSGARHKAANSCYAEPVCIGPHDGRAETVGLGYHGSVRHHKPFSLNSYTIVAVLCVPVDIL